VKEYITVAFSAIALFLSIYNFYRSRKDGRDSDIRTIERKRFEISAILSEIKAFEFRDRTALDAVRFEAVIARRADLVAMIDRQLALIEESIQRFDTMDDGDIVTAAVSGSHKELLAVETSLGRMMDRKARAIASEAQTAGLIAGFRLNMQAASLAAT